MAQMTVSVSEDMLSWLEQRVADGNYASGSDYLAELIRADKAQADHLDWLRVEIAKGFACGVSKRSLQDILADHRNSRAAA
jgi:antitoxin ParD1/3/4